MPGWRRLVVAALLQLLFSRALPADSNCFQKGDLSQGSGYFTCSKPRLNFNDTRSNLTMDLRNKNNNTVFSLSLTRTPDAFHLITLKGNESISSTQFPLPDSSNELRLNINRSSVHAKTRGTWRKLDIPETEGIFSLYFRSHPPNPVFCITCHGGHIWENNKAFERDTSQSTEQGVVQSTQSTEQGVVQSTQSTEQSMAQSTQATEQSETEILLRLSLSLVIIDCFAGFFIIWLIRKLRNQA